MMRAIPIGAALVLVACSGQEEAPVEPAAEPIPAVQPAAESGVSDAVLEMANAWEGPINYAASFDALDPSIQPGAIAANAAFDASDEFWGLPRTEGYEDVLYTCASCHSLRLVMQQSKSAQGWSDMIDWMVEHQGMAAPSEEERERLVEYLATNFAE
jgi:hypothetical protein